MTETHGIRVGEMMMEMVLIDLALSLAAGSRAELAPFQWKLLESYGITVHRLETSLSEIVREGNRTICEGTFHIDIEKHSPQDNKRIRSSGQFCGVINESGAMRIEYSGENFSFKTEIANILTEQGNITYQVSEVVSD